MSARLKELQSEVAAIRRRLDVWAVRLEAVRLRAGVAPRESAAQAGPAAKDVPRDVPAPLFHGLRAGGGALDDVELHFEVLDTEDPGREGR